MRFFKEPETLAEIAETFHIKVLTVAPEGNYEVPELVGSGATLEKANRNLLRNAQEKGAKEIIPKNLTSVTPTPEGGIYTVYAIGYCPINRNPDFDPAA